MATETVERIEIFKATSKRKLHQKIRAASSGPYKITDERVTREGFFKKLYEVTAVITQYVTIAQPQSAVFEEKLVQAAVSSTKEPQTTLLKKEKLIEMLKNGAELTQSTPLLEKKRRQEEELAALKAELASANQVLAEKLRTEREENSAFVQLLRDAGLTDKYIADFTKAGRAAFQSIENIHPDDIGEWFVPFLTGRLPEETAFDLKKHRVISLVGQTGVGKTTTLAKLGYQLMKQGRSVGFITTDTFRSGAVEQFKGYTGKLDAELMVAETPAELYEAIDYLKYVHQVDHILIDTVGRNYLKAESREELLDYSREIRPDLTCFVFSSGTSSQDVLEILPKLSDIPLDGLIITKMDETRRFGDVYTVMEECSMPILYMTDGQNISADIFQPKRRWFAEALYQNAKGETVT
ncbi:flagellar biosynthesis protein FlhF [Listeria ilorinensis]|uniref:flagellar biosynthesis protein FlhF n=1 Tax=Listeria ilorinensis TaxID=2867439 RepID=UPI001EF63769|nr:flagellar biosynthesis protein FlhF [Listeria ilorinensis]